MRLSPPDAEVHDLSLRRAGSSARRKQAEVLDHATWRGRLATRLSLHTDERAWRMGAEGEEPVARQLSKLDPARWLVLHDIAIGTRGANVDHLVVGPGGVFTLNTKNVRGKVWVAERVFMTNGHRTDYLPKAVREAERVSRLLSRAVGGIVPVRGVIVVMCDSFKVKAQPLDVTVVRRREVRPWLEKRPTALAPDHIDRIADAAAAPRTWY